MEVSFILGILIGIVLGLTGAGGGILSVPALMAGMGWTVQQSSPVALIAVACGAMAGLIDALKKKLVYIKEAILISVAAMPFSAIGVRLAHVLPQPTLKIVFAIFLFAVGLRSFKKILPALYRKKRETDQPIQTASSTPPINEIPPSFWASCGIGTIAGLLSGLLGVGGGFVIVPLLQRFAQMPAQKITASSLMVVALISIGSVINALVYGVTLPVRETVAFGTAVVFGVLLGRKLIAYCDENKIQLIFALLLIGVAIGLIISIV